MKVIQGTEKRPAEISIAESEIEPSEPKNVKSLHTSPVVVKGFSYLVVKGSGEDKEEVPISNFTIKPKRVVEMLDGEKELILDVVLEFDDNTAESRFLTPEDFNNRKSFNDAIKTFNGWYTGSENALQHIKVMIYRGVENLDHVLGYKTGGMQKFDYEWGFVTEEGTIFKDGGLNCSIIKQKGSSQKSEIITRPKLSKPSLRSLGETIFSFNTPTISFSLISYIAATFLKERLYDQFKLKFPHLMIAGESGSGKSSTLENIIMKVYSLEDGIISATGMTRFAADTLSNGSNTLPLIIEEYKQSHMDKKQQDLISNVARSSYDRHASIRGNKNMELTELKFLSPLIILGETSMLDETAIAERSISLTLSKKDSIKYNQTFKRLKRNRNLGGLGRNLLESALELSDRDLDKIFDRYREIVDNLEIEVDRLADQILVLAIGMELLRVAFEKEGLDIFEITGYDMESILNLFRENIIEENLNGGKNTKSEMAKTLELMDRAFEHLEGYEIRRTVLLHDLRSGVLGINISSMHEETTRFIDKYSIQEKVLPSKDFTKQLKKSVIYRKYGDQSCKKANIKREGKPETSGNFYLIDLDAAEEEGIELMNLRSWVDAHKSKH
jgi:ABC-type oligopeptide transport system ATPase subunit